MGSDLRRRVERLGRAYRAPPGCGTCRHWTGHVYVGLDGPMRPERCPDCGRAVPIAERIYIAVRLAGL